MNPPQPPIRIGAVSFLNTVPLIDGLEEDPRLELQRDLPSRLADLLWESRIDVGLIPVVEYLRGVGSEIVPGVCIASRGPVRTVRVFSRRPLEEAQDIAVDRGSRSSVALLRVLLAELYGTTPDFHVTEPHPEALFKHYETVLVIGDRAEKVREDGLYIYDLGQMWDSHTGLPFVFAAWVLSPALAGQPEQEIRRSLITRLHEAKARGLSRLPELAVAAAVEWDDQPERIERYWRECIHYDLGPRELEGLQLFSQLAARHNLCPGRESVSLAEA